MSSKPYAEFGIQENAKAFVAARIAMMPCQKWPATSYGAKPLRYNLSESQLTQFCDHFTQFIEAGFKNQPFMRGNSPRFVIRQLTEKGKLTKLQELPVLWARRANNDKCASCQNAPSFYRAIVEEHLPWQSWLNEMSGMLKNADALLLPFVTQAYEQRFDDHGVEIAERGLEVVMLLIDTNFGELLWSSGRLALMPNKRLKSTELSEPLAYPSWELVEERVFSVALWNEFPGRQIY